MAVVPSVAGTNRPCQFDSVTFLLAMPEGRSTGAAALPNSVRWQLLPQQLIQAQTCTHAESCAAGTSGVNTESRYPRADLSQQEVIADKMVFTQALKRLHEEMRTQYRVPQVSGRELDLFLLYKQVS
jgi:hypothetical protein